MKSLRSIASAIGCLALSLTLAAGCSPDHKNCVSSAGEHAPKLVVSRTAAAGASTSTISTADRLVLAETYTDTVVGLPAGSVLTVVLGGNPTTGYQWEIEKIDAEILAQVGEAQFEPDSPALGSGGKVILRFKGMAAGQTDLSLIYHRSFEEDVPPLERFAVRVVVR